MGGPLMQEKEKSPSIADLSHGLQLNTSLLMNCKSGIHKKKNF